MELQISNTDPDNPGLTVSSSREPRSRLRRWTLKQERCCGLPSRAILPTQLGLQISNTDPDNPGLMQQLAAANAAVTRLEVELDDILNSGNQ